MNKPLYLILSLIIFIVISPIFNGLFYFILSSFDDYFGDYFTLDMFTFALLISYITTFIPALVVGVVYGVLSFTRKKRTLAWLIPILGCVIYLVYAFIFEISLITALLSIGGSFICTMIANSTINTYQIDDLSQ